MSIWVMLCAALVGLLSVSVLVGLSLATILGQVSREVSDLFEAESLSTTPTSGSGAARRRRLYAA